MYQTTTLPLTPTARQPIIAFQPAPQRFAIPDAAPRPMPTHDFLILSACPDFTTELNAAGATTLRERATQLCA